MKPTVLETFWDHVDRSDGPDACWPWTRARIPVQRRRKATVDRGGYGSVTVAGRQHGAHRVAYEMANGPIPAGMLVRHSCDNPPCCNPAHLSLGTQADNTRDKIVRRRWGDCANIDPPLGEDKCNAKLTEVEVREIRWLRSEGETQVRLAELFNVSRGTIRSLLDGKTWKHLDAERKAA